jgi:hypothetical protein
MSSRISQIEGTAVGKIFAEKLGGGEGLVSWFQGRRRPSDLLTFLLGPTMTNNRDFLVGLTGYRVIIIELKWFSLTPNEKVTHTYALGDVLHVRAQKHILTSTVTLECKDGAKYILKDVSQDKAQEFAESFNRLKPTNDT